jgi:hypothetical protein
MTAIEQIRSLTEANRPFRLRLSDARVLEVKGRDWISTHPSGQGTSLTVYGPGDDEEHWIPIFAITSISTTGPGSNGQE